MLPVLLSQEEVLRFAVVLFRIAGIMAFAPFFSSSAIPYQVRVVITLVAAVALFPSVPPGFLPGELSLVSLSGLVLSEVVFGLVLGVIVR